jgi:two-component system response regulator GlrR
MEPDMSFNNGTGEIPSLPQTFIKQVWSEGDANLLNGWQARKQVSEEEALAHSLKGKVGLRQLVGESPKFRVQIRKIPLVARRNVSVLIEGETGTGKELCARAIHYLSPRAHQPFVPVNCGAIPTDLAENELFGHARGAFTGASAAQHGLIREAEGGSLFLDEIDCLPLLTQVKLLRFLQEKEYKPLGSAKVQQADVRVIAAINMDLEEAVRTGRLRRDLYYRLNVMTLLLPPLRERPEDIPLLAHHFLVKYATEFDNAVTSFSPDVMSLFLQHEWPGNIRELEHVIERAVLLAEQPVIDTVDIANPALETVPVNDSFQEAKAKVVAQFEKTYIQGLLSAYHGNITKAAQAAGKNRRAFWQLVQKYGINAHDFRSSAV